MALPEPTFRDVDRMMQHLEAAIDGNTATPKLLAAMQKRLDIIDDMFRDDPAVADDYHKLLELQALIYGTERKDAQAKKFMDGAIQLVGGPHKLSSRLLKVYIRDHNNAEEAAEATPHDSSPIRFLAMPPIRLVLLCIFTGGLYELYWFYKNWQAIKQAQPQKMWPFWRAIFAFFWAWPLFKTVLANAKQRGYERSYSPGLLAFLYVLFGIIGSNSGRVPENSVALSIGAFAVLILGVLPLVPVQRAINFNNAQLKAKPHKTSKPEVALIVVGVIIFVLSTIGWFVPLSKVQNSIYPSEHLAQIKQQKSQMDSLTQQYNGCSSALKARGPKVDTTDPEAIDKYNKDLATCDAIRVQQNAAVDKYNSLIATKQPS